MAVEAAPPPSLDAQHMEEYIDYSEDDTTGPPVVAQGSNHSSFSANAHVITEVSDKAAENLQLDNETIVVQAEIEPVAVDGEVDQEEASHESAGECNANNDASIDDVLEVAEDASFNDNEISWEDGPNDGPAADLAGDDNGEEGDWQVFEQQAQAVDGEAESMPEEAKQPQDESEEAAKHNPDYDDTVDADQQESVAADGDSSSSEQAAGPHEGGADGDLHEIDYFEDGNAPADTSIEGAEVQQDGHILGQYTTDNAQPDLDAQDHAMGEGADTPLQHETETSVAIDDDGNDQDVEDQAHHTQETLAAGGDVLAQDRMEYEEDELLASVQSPESDDAPSNDDMEIPSITVIYKGVEYPFFYNSPGSEGKECFFDDLSLLHCKMEGVLAGFRRELSNELNSLEDLVFQIDELGLEFAESTQPEMFSDITLGQILSLFDSLVKNGEPEDPDASRPLYAFLTTRPNCKRKWLSLVEDAYNGKGLDEVIYHFATPGQSRAATPEILDDEPEMIGETDNADAAAWANSPVDSQDGNQDDAPNEADQDVTVNHSELHEDDDVGDGMAEDEDTTQAQNIADEEPIYAELTAVENLDAEATMVETVTDETTIVADVDIFESNNMTNTVEEQEPQNHGENAPDIDTSNPLIDEDTGEVDVLHLDGDEQNWPNDEDTTAIMDQIIEGTDANSANKVTPNTSATSTLNGDEVANEDNDFDMNADMVDNNNETANDGDQNDELGEIDWREYPEQGEDEIAKSPSVAGKRPRSDVDDLLDDEAEKEVKRRRP